MFVQYTTKDGTNTLDQTVLVCKNPCYSIGDMRILRAVDYSELYHHVNTIVFPRVGPRSIPDMITGMHMEFQEGLGAG